MLSAHPDIPPPWEYVLRQRDAAVARCSCWTAVARFSKTPQRPGPLSGYRTMTAGGGSDPRLGANGGDRPDKTRVVDLCRLRSGHAERSAAIAGGQRGPPTCRPATSSTGTSARSTCGRGGTGHRRRGQRPLAGAVGSPTRRRSWIRGLPPSRAEQFRARVRKRFHRAGSDRAAVHRGPVSAEAPQPAQSHSAQVVARPPIPKP